jgi:GDP-L-fucose synthase
MNILDLAQTITEIVGFRVQIVTDQSKPDGTPRKLIDVSKSGSLGGEYLSMVPQAGGVMGLYPSHSPQGERRQRDSH